MLDDTDKAILNLLQDDATLPLKTIAERVHVSVATAQRRIQALTDSGVITRQVAIVDPNKVGSPTPRSQTITQKRCCRYLLSAGYSRPSCCWSCPTVRIVHCSQVRDSLQLIIRNLEPPRRPTAVRSNTGRYSCQGLSKSIIPWSLTSTICNFTTRIYALSFSVSGTYGYPSSRLEAQYETGLAIREQENVQTISRQRPCHTYTRSWDSETRGIRACTSLERLSSRSLQCGDRIHGHLPGRCLD